MEIIKELTFHNEGREKLIIGIDKVANAVKVTLGAKGRNVILDRNPYPHITKDGVTVAKEINLEDAIESMGARLIKQVASKTAEDNGDGTTTSTVLAQQIAKKGLKAIETHPPMEVKKGMELAVKEVSTFLKENSTPIDIDKNTLYKVALISANGDESIAELVSLVMNKIKLDGIYDLEESGLQETIVDMIEGTKILSSFLSPHFINDENKSRVVLEDAYVFMMDGVLNNINDLSPVFTQYNALGTTKPLVFMANDVNGEALSTLIINKVKGKISTVAIRVPGLTDEKIETLKDIQSVVGGTIINQASGIMLKDFTKEMFGKIDRIVVEREFTIITNRKKDGIKKRASEIKSQIESVKEDVFLREKLKARLARLNGAVAVIKVGGTTEVEMKERKDRVEDALGAVASAMKEGIVPGGGIALFRSFLHLKNTTVKSKSQSVGYSIILDSLSEPLIQILKNGDKDYESIIQKLNKKDFAYGYDVQKEEIVDMIEVGIIDPVKVVRNALENASSIASMLLTTECVISNKRQN